MDTIHTRDFPYEAFVESMTLMFVTYVVYVLMKRNESLQEKRKLFLENMQVGFVTGKLMLDNEGNPVDYQFDYINQELLHILGCSSHLVWFFPFKHIKTNALT